MLSNYYKEIYQEVNKINVDSSDVFDLVHDYLIHSGFVGTLRAFEDESSFELMQTENGEYLNKMSDMYNKLHATSFHMQRKNTLGPDMIKPLTCTSGIIPEIEEKRSTKEKVTSF